jgi:hypothetical protein
MAASPLHTRFLRPALAGAALLSLAACSFSGSADDPDASGSSRPSSSSSAPSSPAGGSSGTASGAVPTTGAAADTGSSGSGTSGGSGSGGSGGTDRCHTSELTGSLTGADAGAGQRYLTLVLRNTGGETCTIDGYGGVGLVDARGAALPTDQIRVASPAPALLTLRPGASASSVLHWTVVPGSGDAQTGDCQPTAATLRVIPPDETDALSVAWTGGPVCQGGTLQQQAYTAG